MGTERVDTTEAGHGGGWEATEAGHGGVETTGAGHGEGGDNWSGARRGSGRLKRCTEEETGGGGEGAMAVIVVAAPVLEREIQSLRSAESDLRGTQPSVPCSK